MNMTLITIVYSTVCNNSRSKKRIMQKYSTFITELHLRISLWAMVNQCDGFQIKIISSLINKMFKNCYSHTLYAIHLDYEAKHC